MIQCHVIVKVFLPTWTRCLCCKIHGWHVCIQHISKQFPVVGSPILFPKFSFLKAVDDSLIEPDIECWDYSFVKNIAGQGQIYIRVHKNLKVTGDPLDHESDSEDNEIHFLFVAAYKKRRSIKAKQ